MHLSYLVSKAPSPAMTLYVDPLLRTRSKQRSAPLIVRGAWPASRSVSINPDDAQRVEPCTSSSCPQTVLHSFLGRLQ